MKISKYTKLIKFNKKNFVYNSISNFLCEIDENLYKILFVKQNNNAEIELSEIDDDETWNLLKKNKITTDNEKDDLLFISAPFYQMRRISHILNLTLTPTMDCNFHCPYCFETKKKGKMSSETIENIVKFVTNYEHIKYINLTWFGGEPLLAPEVIEKISDRICHSEKYNYSAKIITNGYYLTKENLEILEKSEVNFIQLSMDGIFEFHNSKRFTKTDKDTFSKIINNIDTFSKSDFNIKLGIRVNLGSDNINEFTSVSDFFRERYGNDKRITVVPAFIMNTTKNDNETTISNFEKKLECWSKVAILTNNSKRLYPENDITECAIRNYNAWTIDAQGFAYKCWEIVGNENYIVGELTNSGINITNSNLYNRYLFGANHLENRKCQDCFSLPICGGGCPHKRIENEFNNKNFDLCTFKEENLEKYLIERIKFQYK